ncbi:autotransporter domain-containing protein [Stenotrophomonas mori]|uniref:Autotransporter domain-containing protein n=1 Tax=Stenotrophomonas mori TaxID=2871096 RepID=A0ABT0SLR4_9GAMM|nr:autotransporter domain-containing protein [Stenotrophomonas mori]MCL7715864.1 autotransporter domain-containing protein [Stenotrophomonas mori]
MSRSKSVSGSTRTPPRRWALATSISAALLSQAWLPAPAAAQASPGPLNEWLGGIDEDVTETRNWAEGATGRNLGHARINGQGARPAVWRIGDAHPPFFDDELTFQSLAIGEGAGADGHMVIRAPAGAVYRQAGFSLNGQGQTGPLLSVGTQGGTGRLDFDLNTTGPGKGTVVEISNTANGGFLVGDGAGSRGTVNIQGSGNSRYSQTHYNELSGGKVVSDWGSHFIGSDGGTGTVNLVDASWLTVRSVAHPGMQTFDPQLSLGTGTGSVGNINVLAGGKMQTGVDPYHELHAVDVIGADGGRGTLRIAGANANGHVSKAAFSSGLDIGRGLDAQGTVKVEDGALLLTYANEAGLYDPQDGEPIPPPPVRIGVDGGVGEVSVSGAGSRWNVGGAVSHNSTKKIVDDGQGNVVIREEIEPVGPEHASSAAGNLYLGVSGTGSLTIADGGTVSLGTAYLGEVTEYIPGSGPEYYDLIRFDDGLGTLFIGSSASGDGTLNIGAAEGRTARSSGKLLAAKVQFGPGAGKVVFNHTDGDLVFSTPLAGSGTLAVHAGTTWLQPASATADNRGFSGLTELYGGVLGLGYDKALGGSSVQVKDDAALAYGAGTRIANTIELQGSATLAAQVAAGGTAVQAGSISGTGNLAKASAGTLVLSGANTFSGQTHVAEGTLALSGAGSLAHSRRVRADGRFDIAAAAAPAEIKSLAGSGTVHLGGQSLALTDAADTFAGSLTGSGRFDVLSGRQILTGDSSAFAGDTHVHGQLWMNGALGKAGTRVTVYNGAELGGNGRYGGSVTIRDGGALGRVAPQSVPGTIRIGGDLELGANATLRYLFGRVGEVGGAFNDLISVGGDLVLDGVLEITEAPGGHLDPGLYRLMDYGGTLDDRGLVVGSIPSSFATALVDTGVDKQVNLLLGRAGVAFSFWDGAAGPANNGEVNGGDGVWQSSAGNHHWTDLGGTLNGPFSDGSFAVFAGEAGTVTVDDSLGAVEVAGMQFVTSGYVLQGDPITLLGPEATVRVGDSMAGETDFLSETEEKAVTIDSVLTGASRLVKTDEGTLILTGRNTYGGGTHIRDGLLQIAADEALGAADGDLVFGRSALRTTASMASSRDISITTAAALLQQRDTTLTLSGDISGTGALNKAGAGTLHLTGDSGLSGPTRVVAGMLQVDGRLAHSAVSVDYSALLSGTGTVGSTTIRNGGSIAPGGSIGTLQVDGDYLQQAGGRYVVEVDPSSNRSDLIAVSGAARIDPGAVLQVERASDALYRVGSRYTVLAAEGGVDGTYTVQAALSPFLALKDLYDANHAYLEVIQARQLTDIDCSPNARAAASGANGLAPTGELMPALLNQPDEAAACDALGQLSGEIHASMRGVQLEDSRFVREAVDMRLRGAMADAEGQAEDAGAWVQAFGSSGRFEHGTQTRRLDRDTSGLFLGVDRQFSGGWRVGVLGGYGTSDFRVRSWRSSASSKDTHLAVYAGVDWSSGLALQAGAAHAWHDVDVKRQVAFAHYSDSLRSRYDARTRQLFAEVSYRLDLGRDELSVQPFLGAAHVQLRNDGFHESGGEAALAARAQDNRLTFATLGLRGARRFDLERGGTLSVRGMAGWRQAFGDRSADVALGFVEGGTFTLQGVPLARQTLAAELGLDVSPRRNLRLGVGYSGQLGGGTHDHGGKAFVEWKF